MKMRNFKKAVFFLSIMFVMLFAVSANANTIAFLFEGKQPNSVARIDVRDYVISSDNENVKIVFTFRDGSTFTYNFNGYRNVDVLDLAKAFEKQNLKYGFVDLTDGLNY